MSGDLNIPKIHATLSFNAENIHEACYLMRRKLLETKNLLFDADQTEQNGNCLADDILEITSKITLLDRLMTFADYSEDGKINLDMETFEFISKFYKC
jgi:hypothetical protein